MVEWEILRPDGSIFMSNKKKKAKHTDEERESRVKSAADKFFGAFAFTENGRPKSGFFVYTFFLSIAFILVYVFIFGIALDYLPEPLSIFQTWASNLIISLLVGIVGTAICCIFHHFFKDKRMVFVSFVWIAVYAVVILITMLIMLKGESMDVVLTFMGWFVFIPLAIGLLVSGYLMKRDWHPEPPREEVPEWKKYVNRR